MTRRSFYLSNLRRISGYGGEKWRGKKSESCGGRNREKRKNEDSAEDIDVGVNVDVTGDTIHRSRSTASIHSLRPLRPRFEDFDLPFREGERESLLPSTSRTIDRTFNYAICIFSSRASTCLRNVVGRNAPADALSGYPWFRIDDDVNENGGGEHRCWVMRSEGWGGRNFKADPIGSIDSRVSRDIVSSVDAPRANACFSRRSIKGRARRIRIDRSYFFLYFTMTPGKLGTLISRCWLISWKYEFLILRCKRMFY